MCAPSDFHFSQPRAGAGGAEEIKGINNYSATALVYNRQFIIAIVFKDIYIYAFYAYRFSSAALHISSLWST